MIRWSPRLLASGLAFPEGPVVLGPDDVALVEVDAGRVSRARGGRVEVLAETGGGPNGLARWTDGTLFVANNGGLSIGPGGYRFTDDFGNGRIQRITGGVVEDLVTAFPSDPPWRPNDLALGPDGALYVTDPHNWEDLANLRPGRVYRVTLDGAVEVLAEVEGFCNGIAFAADGALLVARSIGQCVDRYPWADGVLGAPSTFCRLPDGFPDGICLLPGDELVVCGSTGNVIGVFDPDGAPLQTIATGADTEPTNCARGDGVLYVTLSGTGELIALDAIAG